MKVGDVVTYITLEGAPYHRTATGIVVGVDAVRCKVKWIFQPWWWKDCQPEAYLPITDLRVEGHCELP